VDTITTKIFWPRACLCGALWRIHEPRRVKYRCAGHAVLVVRPEGATWEHQDCATAPEGSPEGDPVHGVRP
jgi:hypothetical protein